MIDFSYFYNPGMNISHSTPLSYNNLHEGKNIFQTKPTYSLQNDRNRLVLHETTRTWLFSATMYTNVGLFPGDILWGALKYQETQ